MIEMTVNGRQLRHSVLLVAFVTLTLTLPADQARAALVRTESVLLDERAQGLRATWLRSLKRAEVHAALEQQGVSVEEAERRVQSLSDREILAIAQRIDELPAGQGAETVIVAVLVVFALLVILDAAGVTDIFPGIQKNP